MPLALAGSLTAVQICYPADLSLTLNKIEHFSKVSPFINVSRFSGLKKERDSFLSYLHFSRVLK
jgi:hypothetical protein